MRKLSVKKLMALVAIGGVIVFTLSAGAAANQGQRRGRNNPPIDCPNQGYQWTEDCRRLEAFEWCRQYGQDWQPGRQGGCRRGRR